MTKQDPRRWALAALNDLEKGRFTLDRIIEEIHETGMEISRRDRNLFNALTYGVVRWKKRLDWVIGQYSKTPLRKIDPAVCNILRLALFQVLFLDRVPDSAAINTAVDLAKTVSPPWVVRFVNGVLRNAARSVQDLKYPLAEEDPVQSLAIRHSYPEWLVKRWIHRFGASTADAICCSGNRIAPLTVRVNRLLTTRDALVRSVSGQANRVESTPISPDGVSLWGLETAVSEMEAFKNGCFQVQDEAAQLVTRFLDPKPDETVLDACAGFGGKTGHISQMMDNRGCVVALDYRQVKLDRLEREMQRIGATIVTTCRSDLSRADVKIPHREYDRVLLDAPCSGAGVIRRNPDNKWRLKEDTFAACATRQKRFLSQLADRVKPSGILVYAVCSTEPEENEGVVKEFLNNHPEFVMENPGAGFPVEAGTLLNENGILKTATHEHGMDGFFAARLRRSA